MDFGHSKVKQVDVLIDEINLKVKGVINLGELEQLIIPTV